MQFIAGKISLQAGNVQSWRDTYNGDEGHSWARDMGQSIKLVKHCSSGWGEHSWHCWDGGCGSGVEVLLRCALISWWQQNTVTPSLGFCVLFFFFSVRRIHCLLFAECYLALCHAVFHLRPLIKAINVLWKRGNSKLWFCVGAEPLALDKSLSALWSKMLAFSIQMWCGTASWPHGT